MPKIKDKPLSQKLQEDGYNGQPQNREPLWKGPCGEGPQGGVTQSLISRAVACGERFRLKTIEGLAPPDQFNHRLEYGNMWHVCEENFASGINSPAGDWRVGLPRYCQELNQKYRVSGDEIAHWYNVCRAQFPIYVEHWKKHPDVKDRTPLLQEQVFDVPYKLPSGRVVRLRGKWDSVDLIGRGKSAGVWLMENKSKGDIDERQLIRQLTFDLQTLFYLVAMASWKPKPCFEWSHPIKGVRYNVIRRPLSGGKHTIRQLQPTKANPAGESKEEFYSRLGGLIQGEPEFFFMRWKVEISAGDVDRFKREFFHPFLENLVDDYEWWAWCAGQEKHKPWDESVFDYNRRGARFPHHRLRCYRLPYGCYNPVAEGRVGDYDDLLATGSESGLVRCTDLFPELN